MQGFNLKSNLVQPGFQKLQIPQFGQINPCLSSGQFERNFRAGVRRSSQDGDNIGQPPDWNSEMGIFKQRLNAPNQLALIRELQQQVNSGKVISIGDQIAIVDGLDVDAELGTKVRFSNGVFGVLIWRRSSSVCYVLMLDGYGSVTLGADVECIVGGILQVVDDKQGPMSKREFEEVEVPVGPQLCSRVLDYFCRDYYTKQPIKTSTTLPLLNQQVAMKNRESITQPLITGVRGLDVLTPLGRGQALLVSGAKSSYQHDLGLECILAQKRSDVRVVYGLIGQTESLVKQDLNQLEKNHCMDYTTVVVATEDQSLGEQYAAICTTMSIAEYFRDKGGHVLVLINDINPVSNLWDTVSSKMAEMGPEFAEFDLKELNNKNDTNNNNGDDPQPSGMVDYGGMLISIAAAQRRRFFASLIQRSAKVSRGLGGGSLTLVPFLPGSPATGEMIKAKAMIEKYNTLSEGQREKLLEALESKGLLKKEGQMEVVGEGEVRTEVVEEFMSITDGQVIVAKEPDRITNSWKINASQSISRIGSRAHPKAMEELAPKVRLQLAQVADVKRFSSNPNSPENQRDLKMGELVEAAMSQFSGAPLSFEQQIIQIYALQSNCLNEVNVSMIQGVLNKIYDVVKGKHGEVVEELTQTSILTEKSKRIIEAVSQEVAKTLIRSLQ